VNNETTALLNRLPLIIALLKDLHTRDSNNETICAAAYLPALQTNRQITRQNRWQCQWVSYNTELHAIGSKLQTIKMQLYKLHRTGNDCVEYQPGTLGLK